MLGPINAISNAWYANSSTIYLKGQVDILNYHIEYLKNQIINIDDERKDLQRQINKLMKIEEPEELPDYVSNIKVRSRGIRRAIEEEAENIVPLADGFIEP